MFITVVLWKNVGKCMLLVGGARGWYLLTGTTLSSSSSSPPVAIPSLAPVSTPALTVPLPVSNACLKAGRGGVDARDNGNGRHFKLVSHAAVFAFLFGHAQRENAAYYNEMKCNLHLNAFTKTHTHTHTVLAKGKRKAS